MAPGSPRTAVVWFRRDLRVHDQPALAHALAVADRIAPLVVLDDALLARHAASRNRIWFMARSVEALATALADRGAPLTVRRGRPEHVVAGFAAEVGAERVVVTRELTPYARGRDARVAGALAARGVAFDAGRGLLVQEPEAVRRVGGGAYAVFGPFHRAWSALSLRPVLPAPDELPGIERDAASASEPAPLLREIEPTAHRDLLPAPGEAAARERLAAWAGSGRLERYTADRDRLDLEGTSRLSQDLRFGLLSPVEVAARCAGAGEGRARFLTELAWRDFYAHLLWWQPRVLRESFRRDLADLAWADDPAGLAAWQDGRTGYPVVDAAMRQLRATGWMHDRARMVVASFLTKHLGIDWRAGEAHFLVHLVDGDVASNNGGWQWAASTGSDPQPFFRIFNPTLQGRRHDPHGDYVRRWVPELRTIDGPDVHAPSDEQRAAAGYPPPIVDHAGARARALARHASATARE
jgi:deoxyribodipyrimidine photo-lyase